MILDYSHKVDFRDNKSLRRFRRWLSFKMAGFIAIIEEREESAIFFQNPKIRPMGSDYLEAIRNLENVKHWHWAITEIINHSEK